MSSGAAGRIAVDAMGGDLGPAEIVAAVKLAFHQYPQLNPITLVGDEAQLKPLLAHSHDQVGYVHIGAASWPSGHSTAAG